MSVSCIYAKKNRKQTKIFKENVQQCEEDNDDDGKEITEKKIIQ